MALREFSTRRLHGPLFYKRRPKQVREAAGFRGCPGRLPRVRVFYGVWGGIWGVLGHLRSLASALVQRDAVAAEEGAEVRRVARAEVPVRRAREPGGPDAFRLFFRKTIASSRKAAKTSII